MKVIAITDSAFRKEDKTGLAVKGAVIGNIQALDEQPGGDLHVLECFSKKQRRVTRSTYGAELLSLSDGVEFAKRVAVTLAELYAPNSNLDTLRAAEETGDWPVKVEFVIDAKLVYESIVAEQEKIPAEYSLILVLLQLREGLQVGRLSRAWWCHTGDMLADALTKGGISRNAFIEALEQGTWKLKEIAESSWSRKAIQRND